MNSNDRWCSYKVELTPLSGEMAIVLDDYHFIGIASINDSLCYLLEHLPRRTEYTDRKTSDSQELLASLEQLNLFIIPLDEERNWYRYHHLLSSTAYFVKRRPDKWM